MPTIEISKIKIGDRCRKDLGDIEGLAASIEVSDLLQPIVLDKSASLICGYRRIEAHKLLGRTAIEYVTAISLKDAYDYARAEQDENTCRKNLLPTEMHVINELMRALERPKAKARQQEAGRTKGRSKAANSLWSRDHKLNSDTKPAKAEPGGKVKHNAVRDAIGKAVGSSGATVDRIRQVMKAAEKSKKYADLPALMDRTGPVAAVRELNRRMGGKKPKPRPKKADKIDKLLALSAEIVALVDVRPALWNDTASRRVAKELHEALLKFFERT